MSDRNDRSLLYSSFNARALSPRDVAQTFVPPPTFFKLTNNSHTFVVGPRGSGKTTLLKMLQQPAMEAWCHADAEELRRVVSFTGVFIPTDVTFTSQLEALVGGIAGGESILRAAYAIHILRAVFFAIEYRTGRIAAPSPCTPINRVQMSAQQEQEFIAAVARGLNRQPRIPSFAAFRSEISAWLLDLFQFTRTQHFLSETEQRAALAESDFLRLDMTRTAALVIEQFESICGIDEGRWALLFDELELAPSLIVQDLTRLVRSTDERFLFKLSLSPYTAGTARIDRIITATAGVPLKVETPYDEPNYDDSADSAPPAQENEDFETIRLWYPNKRDGFPFCQALAQSVIAAKGFGNQTLESMLGTSVFDTPARSKAKSGSLYNPGSSRNKRMKRLAEVDPSFRRYLRAKGIDLNRRINEDDMRAKTLRKINGIVIVREAFRGPAGSKRGRKNPQLYTGASAFYAICEANPRLLIGLLNQLLGEQSTVEATSNTPDVEMIQGARQAEVFASASARFRAYLRTIPSPRIAASASHRGLLAVIDAIGKYFFNEVVLEDFDDDPDTSFIVDARASVPLCDALQRALNAGAIVWVPDKSDGTLLSSIRGKRFRLSYLLAPYHRLPLQLGRAISLSGILEPKRASRNNAGPFLFDLSESEDS